MTPVKRAVKKENRYEALLWKVWDGLRGVLLRDESTPLVLTLCALYCKARQSKKFTGSPEQAHQFIAKLANGCPEEFNRPLELLKSVPPGLLVQLLGVLDELSVLPEGLENLWDDAVKEDRLAALTRFLSPTLAEFCSIIGEVGKGDRVLCPFAPSFDFARAVHHRGGTLTLESRDSLFLALLFRDIFDPSIKVSEADPINRVAAGVTKVERFDVVLSSPPLSIRIDPDIFGTQMQAYRFKTRHLEGLAIQQAVALAKRRAVVLVGLGMASRTTADERELKRYLVDNELLEAVIKLPSGSFEWTKIAPVAFVLRGAEQKPRPGTLVVDASHLDLAKNSGAAFLDFADLILKGKDGEFMRRVDPKEVAQNLFNLDPSRYLVNDEKRKISEYLESRKTAALSEVGEILRPQLLPQVEGAGQEVREVAFGDIQEDGIVVTPEKTRHMAPDAVKRFDRFILRPGDILLSVKGSVGRIGLVEDTFNEIWIPSQSFVIVRLDPREQRLSSKYLFYFLSSWVGQGQINAAPGGSLVRIVQASDVRELRVALPTPDEEGKVAEAHVKISRLRMEILEAGQKISRLRQELHEAEGRLGGH